MVTVKSHKYIVRVLQKNLMTTMVFHKLSVIEIITSHSYVMSL